MVDLTVEGISNWDWDKLINIKDEDLLPKIKTSCMASDESSNYMGTVGQGCYTQAVMDVPNRFPKYFYQTSVTTPDKVQRNVEPSLSNYSLWGQNSTIGGKIEVFTSEPFSMFTNDPEVMTGNLLNTSNQSELVSTSGNVTTTSQITNDINCLTSKLSNLSFQNQQKTSEWGLNSSANGNTITSANFYSNSLSPTHFYQSRHLSGSKNKYGAIDFHEKKINIPKRDVSGKRLYERLGTPKPMLYNGAHHQNNGTRQLEGYLASSAPHMRVDNINVRNNKANLMLVSTEGTISNSNLQHRHSQLSLTFGWAGKDDGLLCRPWGVACSHEGNIVVTDRTNNRVQVYTKTGLFLFKFGEQGQKPGQFFRPAGVAVNNKNQIIIADKDNHRIQLFNKYGQFIDMFGKPGKSYGQFSFPWDVAVNTYGLLAVSDSKNRRVQIFDENHNFLTKIDFEFNRLELPRGLAFYENENLMLSDFNRHKVLIFNKLMMCIRCVGDLGTEPSFFNRPQCIATNKELRCYAVSDGKNNRVQVFDYMHNLISILKCEGPAGPSTPQGLCFHPDGSLIVVNLENFVQVFFYPAWLTSFKDGNSGGRWMYFNH